MSPSSLKVLKYNVENDHISHEFYESRFNINSFNEEADKKQRLTTHSNYKVCFLEKNRKWCEKFWIWIFASKNQLRIMIASYEFHKNVMLQHDTPTPL
jgi:hypothetical protein